MLTQESIIAVPTPGLAFESAIPGPSSDIESLIKLAGVDLIAMWTFLAGP